jgi:hypothetical protein
MSLAAEILWANGFKENGRDLMEDAVDWYNNRSKEAKLGYRRSFIQALYFSTIMNDRLPKTDADPENSQQLQTFSSIRENNIALIRDISDELLREDRENLTDLGRRGFYEAYFENRDEAMRIYRILGDLDSPYMRGTNIAFQAQIMAVLGEDDEKAVSLFEDAFKKGNAYDLWFHYDPNLEDLRKYEGFQEFLKPKK